MAVRSVGRAASALRSGHRETPVATLEYVRGTLLPRSRESSKRSHRCARSMVGGARGAGVSRDVRAIDRAGSDDPRHGGRGRDGSVRGGFRENGSRFPGACSAIAHRSGSGNGRGRHDENASRIRRARGCRKEEARHGPPSERRAGGRSSRRRAPRSARASVSKCEGDRTKGAGHDAGVGPETRRPCARWLTVGRFEGAPTEWLGGSRCGRPRGHDGAMQPGERRAAVTEFGHAGGGAIRTPQARRAPFGCGIGRRRKPWPSGR